MCVCVCYVSTRYTYFASARGIKEVRRYPKTTVPEGRRYPKTTVPEGRRYPKTTVPEGSPSSERLAK